MATNPAREPTLWETVARFRADLEAREMAARREMLRSWEPVRRAVVRETGRLTQRIAERQIAGERVPVSWLFGQARMAEWELRIRRELADFKRAAEGPLSRAFRDAATIGPAHALELIRKRAIPFPELAARRLVRFPAAEVETMVAALQEGSPLAELLDRMGADTATAMREALIRNVALGRGAVELGKELGGILDGNLRRGLLIGRTETLRAYRETTRAAYEAQGDLLAGWRWFSTLDGRTCASCWAMHGTLHPVQERLDDHPAGRCTMVPEVRGLPNEPIPSGESRFAELDPGEQARILGPGRFRLYSEGKATLPDMVARPVHPRWGSMRREANLGQVRANAAARRAGRPTPALEPSTPPELPLRLPEPVAPPEPPAAQEMVERPLREAFALQRSALTDKRDGPVWDAVEHGLATIDRLLRLPALPEAQPVIPVRADSNLHLRGTQGFVRSDRFNGMVHEMTIATNGATKEETVVHEAGHVLDKWLLREGGPEWGSERGTTGAGEAELREVMRLARASQAYERIRADTATRPSAWAYLRSGRELFARAFSQWVGLRSGDARIRAGHVETPGYVFTQWEDADFAPIAEAMDAFFRAKGWLR